MHSLLAVQQQTYMKHFEMENESIADGLDLGGDD